MPDNVTLIRTKIASIPVTTIPVTKNSEDEEVYSFFLSSVQNTKIIILNEETENNIVITPEEEASTQFELSPFFIEELRQAALGNTDRYLVIETDTDFSIRNAASVSKLTEDVFIPTYFYGRVNKIIAGNAINNFSRQGTILSISN